MRLIASDGYTYKDITQRLLGTPEETERNKAIKGVRPSDEAEAFIKGYDEARGRHPERYRAGWLAIDRCRNPQDFPNASTS